MLISTTSGETFHTIYNTNQKNINRPIYNLRPHIVRPVLSTRLLWLLFQVCKMVIQAKRVSNCYIPKKKMSVCSTNLGFSVGTYYVPDTYVPGISRQKSTRTYVMFQIRNTYVPGISRQKSKRTLVRTLFSARGRTRLTCDEMRLSVEFVTVGFLGISRQYCCD